MSQQDLDQIDAMIKKLQDAKKTRANIAQVLAESNSTMQSISQKSVFQSAVKQPEYQTIVSTIQKVKEATTANDVTTIMSTSRIPSVVASQSNTKKTAIDQFLTKYDELINRKSTNSTEMYENDVNVFTRFRDFIADFKKLPLSEEQKNSVLNMTFPKDAQTNYYIIRDSESALITGGTPGSTKAKKKVNPASVPASESTSIPESTSPFEFTSTPESTSTVFLPPTSTSLTAPIPFILPISDTLKYTGTHKIRKIGETGITNMSDVTVRSFFTSSDDTNDDYSISNFLITSDPNNDYTEDELKKYYHNELPGRQAVISPADFRNRVFDPIVQKIKSFTIQQGGQTPEEAKEEAELDLMIAQLELLRVEAKKNIVLNKVNVPNNTNVFNDNTDKIQEEKNKMTEIARDLLLYQIGAPSEKEIDASNQLKVGGVSDDVITSLLVAPNKKIVSEILMQNDPKNYNKSYQTFVNARKNAEIKKFEKNWGLPVEQMNMGMMNQQQMRYSNY